MGLSRLEALRWVVAFGRGFGGTTAPYFGVNKFDVRAESLEPVVANVGVQTNLATTIGGEPKSWSQRDDGELIRVVWVMSYPDGINSRGSGPMAIWRMRSFFPAWFEFCGLIERYEWSVTTELSADDARESGRFAS